MDKSGLNFLSRSLLLLAALFLAGCGGNDGPGTYPVSGTVTLDGEPVPEGRIAFRSPSGEVASAGGTIENGRFSFRSQPGPMQVEITARRETGEIDTSNPGEETPLLEQYIPRKYNVDSDLTKEIRPDSNEFAFELSSDDA